MTEAIRPDFAHMPNLTPAQRDIKADATDEELALYAMSKSAGWEIFESEAQMAIDALSSTNDDAIAQGLPLEEIGRNAVVLSLAKGVVKTLLNKVSDAAEACEKNE